MNFTKVILVLAVLAVVAVAGFGFWFFRSVNSAREHQHSDSYIVIERGSTPSQIITKLSSEGIIGDQMPVLIYLRLFGDASKLQAGEYNFPSPITPVGALKLLEKGSVKTKRLVVPEGFTRFDIAKRIYENFGKPPQPGTDPASFTPVSEDQILLLMSNTSLIKDIAPEAKNLEGYLYPATYELAPDAKPQEMIKTMVEQFRKVWKPEWAERAKQLGRTPHEIVTIASLIETESPVESERPIVSSVIYNRINKSIPLGIDQTVVYVAKMQNRWDGTIHKSDIDADSPYNTRKYGGIPPGPISSVSLSAIEAALNPAQTDYIFYVLDVGRNDGSHHFYASAAEFERGKAVYQKWLAGQRILKRQNEGN